MLWVGFPPVESIDAAGGTSRATLDALPLGAAFDAVVLGPAGELLGACSAVRACVRDGGVVALVLPVERSGLALLTQRALGALDASRRPRPLEVACAALLSAGVAPVKVIDVEGASGRAVVYGVARAAQAASR